MHSARRNGQAPTDTRRVVITLDPALTKDPSKWQQVVQRLKHHGVNVMKELGGIGIVTGTAPFDNFAAIKGENHVIGVEEDQRRSVQ